MPRRIDFVEAVLAGAGTSPPASFTCKTAPLGNWILPRYVEVVPPISYISHLPSGRIKVLRRHFQLQAVSRQIVPNMTDRLTQLQDAIDNVRTSLHGY